MLQIVELRGEKAATFTGDDLRQLVEIMKPWRNTRTIGHWLSLLETKTIEASDYCQCNADDVRPEPPEFRTCGRCDKPIQDAEPSVVPPVIVTTSAYDEAEAEEELTQAQAYDMLGGYMEREDDQGEEQVTLIEEELPAPVDMGKAPSCVFCGRKYGTHEPGTNRCIVQGSRIDTCYSAAPNLLPASEVVGDVGALEFFPPGTWENAKFAVEVQEGQA